MTHHHVYVCECGIALTEVDDVPSDDDITEAIRQIEHPPPTLLGVVQPALQLVDDKAEYVQDGHKLYRVPDEDEVRHVIIDITPTGEDMTACDMILPADRGPDIDLLPCAACSAQLDEDQT